MVFVLICCIFKVSMFFQQRAKKGEALQQVCFLCIMDVAQLEAQHAQRFLGGTGKLFKPLLDHLMLFIVGWPFTRNYIYSDNELNAITPAHMSYSG